MFYEYRDMLCANYNRAKDFFCSHPDMLIEIEHYVSEIVNNTIADNFEELACDYNEASYIVGRHTWSCVQNRGCNYENAAI